MRESTFLLLSVAMFAFFAGLGWYFDGPVFMTWLKTAAVPLVLVRYAFVRAAEARDGKPPEGS